MTQSGMTKPGTAITMEPGLQCILAPNPSPMTGPGTNTFLLGTDEIAVIDPGPQSDAHLEAILAAVGERKVSHIIVTHSHLDHSPLAGPLKDKTQALIYGFGDTYAGRSAVMARLADDGMMGGGEGLDLTFVPDLTVQDGDQLRGADWTMEVMHTPGHLGNHIALKWRDVVFVGDTLMGWSTSLISPPDGDLTDFLRSCRRLAATDARVFYAGHGTPILEPQARAREVIAHREARKLELLRTLAQGPADVLSLVKQIYRDTPPELYIAASRNVFATLVALFQDELVEAAPTLSPDAVFSLSQGKMPIVKNRIEGSGRG